MTIRAKDLAATLLTALVALVFVATHEGWNVPLVGGSHRWAAAAILLLGALTCGLGSPDRSAASSTLGVLGFIALVLGVLALITGSLTPLSLLVADIVVLWLVATYRHVAATHHRGTPMPT